MKFKLISRVLIFWAIILVGNLFWVKQVQATITLEQEINIIDTEYYTTSDSLMPDDNNLGLINWNGEKYNGESVYFEAVVKCDTCSGGNDQIKVALVTKAGFEVTNGSMTTTSETYTRVRSANILTNLSNNTDYSIRILRDATTGSAYIKAARLIVVQSASLISNTQTVVEVGNNYSNSSTTYGLIANPKLFKYSESAYAPSASIYFEASLKSSADNETVYAGLSNSVTCASIVNGSEVSVTGQTWTLIRSNSISLSGESTYWVCVKALNSDITVSLANAKIILDQSYAGGISKTEIYRLLTNTSVTDSDTTYTGFGDYFYFNPSNYTGARFNYFLEADIKTSANTGYARWYNVTDASEVSYSPINTDSTTLVRLRSRDITPNMPSTAKELELQLKNSDTGTTTVAGAYGVINFFDYPNMTFSIAGVTSGTSTNGITTSNSSEFNLLDFGYLITSSPKYLAHQLRVTTNTSYGYTVTVKVQDVLQGNYPGNVIDEFPALWSAPTTWTEPTGETPNQNTGWLGANTSDTRVSGWSSGAGLFGSVGTTANTVMKSAGLESNASIYVTYALEVNQYQPADLYVGTVVYNLLPVY